MTGAYYYTNGRQMVRLQLHPEYRRCGSSAWQEGERFVASLTMVPEYYVDAEGNVAWDKLGAGTTMSFPGIIDNTAPRAAGRFHQHDL